MSTITRHLIGAAALLAFVSLAFADGLPKARFGFGTTPSDAELSRFVSPLPDGRGLPQGSGTVAQGEIIYQEKCAACHGDKMQGGIGGALIGGRGTLVNTDPKKAPKKTIESYWPYATTVFDYTKRAMPLTAPGSLTNDEVYALTAYILAEAKIVPPETTLNAGNLANVQMPNRAGFVKDPRPERFPPPASTPHKFLKTFYPHPSREPKSSSDSRIPGDHSALAPPLPIPNRTVKRGRADDIAGSREK